MARKRIVVHGRVQGVFYRASTRDEAARLGLRGWVRNLRDGARVELVAEGDDAAVAELVRWCHQGPPHARVERVEVVEADAGGEPLGPFDVRPTA